MKRREVEGSKGGKIEVEKVKRWAVGGWRLEAKKLKAKLATPVKCTLAGIKYATL